MSDKTGNSQILTAAVFKHLVEKQDYWEQFVTGAKSPEIKDKIEHDIEKAKRIVYDAFGVGGFIFSSHRGNFDDMAK